MVKKADQAGGRKHQGVLKTTANLCKYWSFHLLPWCGRTGQRLTSLFVCLKQKQVIGVWLQQNRKENLLNFKDDAFQLVNILVVRHQDTQSY